ncbi:Dynactin subunit 6 [Paramyrothecium foliicola]|nr:Dynactin subunit 6 [Paramyrothecium foliicola]
MSSKRHSILPAVDRSGPKPPVHFSSSITISDNAILLGTHSITIQSESVVHPRCRFDSTRGSILVGRRCIVHERTQIGAQPSELNVTTPGGVMLGDYVVVEVGSIIESGDTQIGDGTTIQVGSRIGSGAKIGKNCTISHMSMIAPGEVLPDSTVVYSNGTRRLDKRIVSDMRKLALLRQISVLRKMIPSNPSKFA